MVVSFCSNCFSKFLQAIMPYREVRNKTIAIIFFLKKGGLGKLSVFHFGSIAADNFIIFMQNSFFIAAIQYCREIDWSGYRESMISKHHLCVIPDFLIF